MSTLTWTGQRMPNAGLLYESYIDIGDVKDDDGKWIGEVIQKPNGFYLARIRGIGDHTEHATADSAQREVERLHKTYRS